MPTPPPEYLDDDPVVYHRLTAHGHWSLERLIEMSQDFALLSLEQRRELDEAAPTTGLDPIDIAAGDGQAIFLSLGGPARSNMWAGWRASALKAPGVGFRLSTLLRLGAATVRPVDLQSFYTPLVETFLGKRLGELMDEYDDPEVSVLDTFEPAFALIRKMGEVPATKAIATRVLEHEDVEAKWTERDVHNAFRAIEDAVYEYHGDDDDEDDEDDADDESLDVEGWYSQLRALLEEAWQHPTSPEVVFWGGTLPLSHADVFFDADGKWVFRDEDMRPNPSAHVWVRGG